METKTPLLSRFAAAVFLGSFLLFQVQPLIARYILPWFGGGPSVWTACMLFFQCLLVGGYAYAHGLSRLPQRKQVIIHVCLLILTLPLLPVIPANSWKTDQGGDPTLRIVLLLATTLGLPYFVLSTTSPLLQSWFRRSYPGASPYKLFSLSNAGALLALLTYPVLVEPSFRLRTQALAWSAGYALFIVMFAYCALRTWNTAEPVESEPVPEPAGTPSPAAMPPSPAWAEDPGLLICTLWAALPACGSVILLAVTNQLCWDVSVVPFLWVLPLALYLLSFILCFHSDRWYMRRVFWALLIVAIAIMIALVSAGVDAPIWLQVAGYSGGAFVCFMVCHGETALLKPNPRHLTLYYLMLSIGGAAGGIFVGVAAPRMFTGYAELHVGLWACFALGLLSLRVVHAPYTTMKYRNAARVTAVIETLMVVILGCVLYEHARQQPAGQVRACRNFYGTLRIISHDANNPDRAYYVIQHGRIKHGAQFLSGTLSRKPNSYYCEGSGIGVAISSFPSNYPLRVGIVGLGAGTIAAYGRPGDLYCFYDINPAVIRIAGEVFSYVKDSRASCEIVEGDARISMERERRRRFDVLAIDAFTSDAIPVHLLTREAISLYLSHLARRGILAVHVSNRYLDLEPVVQAIANDLKLHTAIVNYHPTDKEKEDQCDTSTWILLARDRRQLAVEPIRSASARPLMGAQVDCPVWTDDYNDLFMRLVTRGEP